MGNGELTPYPSPNACVVSAQATIYRPLAETSYLHVADDISLFFGNMSVGHGGLLSGGELVALLTLLENPIMSCFQLMWCTYE